MISTHTITRDVWLEPKMIAIIGTRVRIGIACRATINGNVARSISFDWLINVASATPSTTEMARPIPATLHRRPQGVEQFVQVVPLEEATADHLVRRRHQEPPPFRHPDAADEVPEADEDRDQHERRQHDGSDAHDAALGRSTVTVGASINDGAVMASGTVPPTGGP